MVGRVLLVFIEKKMINLLLALNVEMIIIVMMEMGEVALVKLKITMPVMEEALMNLIHEENVMMALPRMEVIGADKSFVLMDVSMQLSNEKMAMRKMMMVELNERLIKDMLEMEETL